MANFKPGDFVVGNRKANAYNITREGVVCMVIRVDEYNGEITVLYNGNKYVVDPRCFNLLNNPAGFPYDKLVDGVIGMLSNGDMFICCHNNLFFQSGGGAPVENVVGGVVLYYEKDGNIQPISIVALTHDISFNKAKEDFAKGYGFWRRGQ